LFNVSISSNVADTIASLNGRMSQVPFATALALTRTAIAVRDAEIHEIKDVFDRPTPYSQNSPRYRGATKQDLSAVVWIDSDVNKGNPPDKYLTPEITGGQRRLKRFELALRSVGALPDGYFVVPGGAVTLDAYGNIPSGLIVQILSYFKAFPDAGYRANKTAKQIAKLAKTTLSHQGFSYFVGAPAGGKLPLGIWQRFGQQRQIRPIMIFVRSTHYNQRFDFQYVGQQTVKLKFAGQFAQAISDAVATAR
jgi:hypothetical protein